MGSQEISDLKDKKEHDRPLEKVLFTCFMYNDGDGDVAHFADFCNSKRLEQTLPRDRSFDITRLLFCPKEREKIVQEKLQEKSISDTYVIYYGKYTSSDTEATFGLREFVDYLKTHPSLQQRLSEVTMIVNISTHQMMNLINQLDDVFKNNPVKLSILEHGGASSRDSHKNDINHRYMGLAAAHHGIALNPRPKLDKASAFLNIKDNFFKRQLLECTVNDEKQAKEYLSKTLLIPLSQYREGPKAFGVILSAVVASEIVQTSDYTTLVFIVGKDNVNEDCFDLDFLQSQNVVELGYKIYRGDGDFQTRQMILESKQAHAKAITVRIIEGYRLDNEDFPLLFSSAQIFGGSSGDKGLEANIENNLIPLILTVPHKNRFNKNFLYFLEKFFPHETLQGFYDMSFVCREELFSNKNTVLAKRISKALNNQVLKSWKSITDTLYKDYNFYDAYPLIFEQGLIQSQLKRFSQTLSNAEKEKLEKRLIQLNVMINKRQVKEMDELVSRVVSFNENHEQKDKHQNERRAVSGFNSNAVNVSGKFFVDEELYSIFKQLDKEYKISLLDLSSNGELSQKTWEAIFNTIEKNKGIQIIFLGRTKMNYKQFSGLLQSLKGNTALTYLDLAFNEINNLKPLIEFLPNSKLVEINLTGNIGVGDDSAQALAAILPKLSLRRINLTGTNVSHKGVQFLQEASKLCDFPMMVIVDNVNVTKQQASGTYLTTHSTAGAEQPKPTDNKPSDKNRPNH